MTIPAGGATALAAALAISFGAQAADVDRVRPATLPVYFSGALDDHTPSDTVTKGGPYAMHGSWTLNVNERQGTANFSAAIDMETSDYGITQGTVDKDVPASRKPHTHHITMTGGVITTDWPARCPTLSPTPTEGFAVTGAAFVTVNGAPVPFGNPSPVTVCILGGYHVKYSNFSLAIGAPASGHFGTQAINGVVERCNKRPKQASRDCRVRE
jgi:hypothetical protein